MQLVDRKKAGEDISTVVQPTTSSNVQDSPPESPTRMTNVPVPSLRIRQSTVSLHSSLRTHSSNILGLAY